MVEPQTYDGIGFLDASRKEELSYFTTGSSGIARTGDGGDSGDAWWKVPPTLKRFLKKWTKQAEVVLGMNKTLCSPHMANVIQN